jgi:Protein of unknown function (DUF664)
LRHVNDSRPQVPYAADERTTLVAFLDWHRATLRLKAGGLDAQQLQRTLPPSDLTLGGMVKHLAYVENWWFGINLAGVTTEPWASVDWAADEDWDWHSAADDTPDQIWDLWETEVAAADATIADSDSLDRLTVRKHPRTGEGLSLRWMLVHMIEEYARHLGHADLIRQSIDGAVGA